MNANVPINEALLRFAVLDGPIAPSVLKQFRKDAGWDHRNGADTPRIPHPGGRVCWATVLMNGRTIAIARLELAPPQFCYVADFIVLENFRGRGVGQWFMHRIEGFCGAQGVPRLVLEPVEGSRPFYERLRFAADPLVRGFLRKDLRGPLLRRHGPG